MKKKKIKIFINEKNQGLIKKLEINTPLLKIREILKDDIKDDFSFYEKDEEEDSLLEITKKDEEDFILEDIIDKNNKIYVKTKTYNINKRENKENNKSNKISVMLNDEKIIEFEDIELTISLSKLRKLYENKILDNYLFLLGNKIIEKEQESDLSIFNVIDKNNCLYLQSKTDYQKENSKENLNKSIKENLKENIKEYTSNNSKNSLIDNSNNDNLKIRDNLKENSENSKGKKNLNIIDNIKENLNQNEILEDNLKQNQKENKISNNDNNNNLEYYLNQLKNLSDLFIKEFINSPEFRNDEIIKEYNYFLENYSDFIGIKRFAIPVFGIISSGKSTLLNYILNLDNILEMGEDISTQFICIIRNKKGLKSPKLYSIKLEWRDETKQFFNFIKDKEIQGDIRTIISEKNKQIRESTLERKPEEYFLLLEKDIPFLNESESNISDLFEFIDFPGLNESIAKNNNKVNLFYRDYLPLLIPNTKFPIFIFEMTKFEGLESSNILEYYKDFSKKYEFPHLDKICHDSFNEAIFILNKSDLLDSEEKKINQLKIFREVYELNEKNTLYFSSKKYLLENNKFNSFCQFIEYIIEDKPPFSDNFIEQLNYQLEKELHIKDINNLLNNLVISKKEKLAEEELGKFNKLINESNFIFEDFNKEQYLKYKNIFLINIPKDNIFKGDNLTNLILSKMKEIYKNFIDLNKFKNSLKLMKDNDNKHFNNFLQTVKKELEKLKIYNPKKLYEITEMIIKFISNFLTISPKSIILTRIKEEILYFNQFLKSNQISIKILLLGKYSSGKSSVLNSIIGYNLNLLEISENECTKKAFIIKYCKGIENISLYKCEKKCNALDFYYFEEKGEIAKGQEKVKNTIKELNKNIGIIFEYYIIKTPIEIFDEFNFSEEIKNYIEFIDLPGFDISGYYDIIFKYEKMINFTDGLIYVNNGSSFENEQNEKAVSNLINQIRDSKLNFSFKSFFFIYTYADKYKMPIEEYKNKLLGFLNCKLQNENFINIKKQDKVFKEKDEILVSKLSNLYYNDYQKLKYFAFEYENPEEMYDNLRKNYFIINEDELDKYVPNKEKMDEISNKIQKKFNLQKTNDLISIISKLYLFILDNIDKYKKYKNSNASQFFNQLETLILTSKENYYTSLSNKFKHLIDKRVFYPLILIRSFCLKKKPIFLPKYEADRRLSNICDIQEKYIKKNNLIFENYLDILNKNIKDLYNLGGKKEFEVKMKKYDEEMNKENEKLKNDLNEIFIELQIKSSKELKEMENKIDELEFNELYSEVSSYIKAYEFAKKYTVGSVGGFGAFGVGLGTYGAITGASFIGNPVAGIVVGGICLLVASGISIYRLVKGKKKVNQEYIDEYYNHALNDIENLKKDIELKIYKISQYYMKRIKEINDLNLEDPYLYLNKKEEFEKYLDELFKYIKSIK